jgi:hypothetical protein
VSTLVETLVALVGVGGARWFARQAASNWLPYWMWNRTFRRVLKEQGLKDALEFAKNVPPPEMYLRQPKRTKKKGLAQRPSATDGRGQA